MEVHAQTVEKCVAEMVDSRGPGSRPLNVHPSPEEVFAVSALSRPLDEENTVVCRVDARRDDLDYALVLLRLVAPHGRKALGELAPSRLVPLDVLSRVAAAVFSEQPLDL